MDIRNIEINRTARTEDVPRAVQKKKEMAMEFERMFARQLVQEMTKDLFKPADNSSVMTSGNQLYRSHIIDSLSQELAEQNILGMSTKVLKHWNIETELSDTK